MTKKNDKLNCKEILTQNNPSKRKEATIIYQQEKIYLFGGFEDQQWQIDRSLFCLNLSTYQWKKICNCNELNFDISEYTIHIWNNYILICFGYHNFGIFIINLNNINQNKHIKLDQKISKRHCHCSQVINDKLIISGGTNACGTVYDDFVVISINELINDKISIKYLDVKLKSMSHEMICFDCNNLFCLGGYDGGDDLIDENDNFIILNVFDKNIYILKNEIKCQPLGDIFLMFCLSDNMDIHLIALSNKVYRITFATKKLIFHYKIID